MSSHLFDDDEDESVGLAGLFDDFDSTREPEDAAPDLADVLTIPGTPAAPDDDGAPMWGVELPEEPPLPDDDDELPPVAPAAPVSAWTAVSSPVPAAVPSAPVAAGATRATGRGRKLLAALLAVVLLAGVGVGGWWWLNRPGTGDAAQVAEDYLAAVAASDAATAAGLLSDPPAGSVWLTSQVLAASEKAAGGRFTVGEPVASGDSSRAEVETRVTFPDGSSETVVLVLVSAGDGVWRVDPASGLVTVDTTAAPAGWRLNGQPVDAGQPLARVFPGTYQLAGPGGYMQTSPQRVMAGVWTVDPEKLQPTVEGESAAVAAWQNMIELCVQQRTVAPAGCPMGFELGDGWKVDKASVKWALDGDPWADVRPTVVAGQPGKVAADVHLSFELTATYTAGGQKTTRTDNYPVDVRMTADLSRSPVTATWSR